AIRASGARRRAQLLSRASALGLAANAPEGCALGLAPGTVTAGYYPAQPGPARARRTLRFGWRWPPSSSRVPGFGGWDHQPAVGCRCFWCAGVRWTEPAELPKRPGLRL